MLFKFRISARLIVATAALATTFAVHNAQAALRAVAPRAVVADSLIATAGAVSLDEAVAQAEKRHNAKVVKTATSQEGGRAVYELRLLSEDGRVWTVRVDSATGAEL